MKDGEKTKEQLTNELRELRRRVAELEASESQRMRGEKALRESERKYRVLVEESPLAVSIIGKDGRYKYINPKFCELFGYSLEDIPSGREWFAKAYPDEEYRSKAFSAWIRDLKRSQRAEVRPREFTVTSKDGSQKTVDFRPLRLESGDHLVVYQDVTDRKRAEEALRESEERFRTFLDNLGDVAYEADSDGNITYANKMAEKLTGLPLADIVGKPFLPLFTEESQRIATAVYHSTLNGESPEYELTLVNGRIGHLKNEPLRDKDGKIVGVFGIARDITERKRAEEESKTLARLGVHLAGAETVESMITAVREETDHLLGWDAHYFAVRRPEEDTFHFVSFVDTVKGEKKTFRKEDWPAANLSAPGRRVLKGRPVLINRKPGDPEPVLDPFGDTKRISASLMNVPVRSGDNVIGILSVQSYTYNRYDEADLQTLQRIADAIAPALERAHAAEALRESEEKYRILFEAAPIGIGVSTPGGSILAQNRTMSEIMGLSPDETHAEALSATYVDPDERQRLLDVLKQPGNVRDREVKRKRPDRTVYSALLNADLMKLGGETLILTTLRDITERKKAEEEKRLLQEQLAEAQKTEALVTLSGGVAHEFNNILAAIIGYTELTLQSEGLSSGARRNLDVVRNSASRGADLTKRLLTFSRKDVRERKRVELRNIVDEVLRVTEKQFTTEGIELSVKHSVSVPPVKGDASMLASVVMNLVINAGHAMRKSPVKKLTVQTGLEKGKAFIRVKDTGCGIPEENIRKVFEPFFTTKGSLAEGEVFDGKSRGTGLGLSVSHSIVEGHGGKMKVTSQVGKGTTFTVYLPPASRRKTTRREPQKGAKERAARIMIVDDEEAIVDLLVDVLVHAGHAAEGFTNPTEALKALRREQYSLAFIDLQMPQMSGEEFIKKVNGLSPEKRPATVVLTGRLDSLQEDYAALGVFTTLTKPFLTEEVLDVVNRGLAASNRCPAGTPDRKPRG